jgi:Branched-chain amino acid transport system / permease component
MTWELFAVFIGSSIRLATPLLLAGIGELVSERAGVLNMSLEGMMLTGAFAGAVGAWATGNPLIGLVIAVVAVAPVAAAQAFLSVTLRANQIVTGIGINILMLGATTLAYREIFGSRSREQIPGLAKWKPPLLGDIPVFGEAVFQQVWLFYLGHLARHHDPRRGRGAARGRQIGAFRPPRSLYGRNVHGLHGRIGGRVPFDRRHSHLYRRNDARRRLSRDRRCDLREMEGSQHLLRLLAVRGRDGHAIPTARDGDRRAQRAVDHDALSAGPAGGCWVGWAPDRTRRTRGAVRPLVAAGRKSDFRCLGGGPCVLIDDRQKLPSTLRHRISLRSIQAT